MLKNLVSASFLIIFLFGSLQGNAQAINGNGNIIRREQSVNEIVSITLKSSSNIILVESSSKKIIIEADEKFMPFIECIVTNGNLLVRNKNEAWFNLTDPIKIYVPAAKTLQKIVNNGSGNISNDSLTIYDNNSIDIKSNASGKVSLNIKCSSLVINKSGSSMIILTGSAKNVKIQSGGSGNILATDLSTETIDVKLKGSGNARLRCSSLVYAEIRGSASLSIVGNPQIIKSKNSSNRIYQIQNETKNRNHM